MAPTVPVCDPCCQNSRLSAMQSQEHFRMSVIQLMCDILAGEGGGGGGGNVNLTGIDGTAPSVGAGAIDAGTLRTTLAAATTVGLAAGSNLIGGVTPQVSTTGGWTPTRISGGLSTTVTALKSSAASKLGALELYNPNSSVAFVQIFNVATAGAVTLGTTVPNKVIGIPPLQSYAMSWGDAGVNFSSGLQVAATTTATGSSAPTTPVEASFDWN